MEYSIWFWFWIAVLIALNLTSTVCIIMIFIIRRKTDEDIKQILDELDWKEGGKP